MSLDQAVANLQAIDARLADLVSAHPSGEQANPDLTAPIREGRALVQAAIALLAGARIHGESPNETLDQAPGGAKRRVKIKAASETTASTPPSRAEAAVRAGTAASKASSKAATRGGGRARSVSSASAATAATAEAPSSSLLARLGAAAPKPGARDRIAPVGSGGPASAPADLPDGLSAHNTSDRLARLEAEIDSLTTASSTADTSRNAMASDEPAVPAAAKGTATQPRVRDDTAPPASVSAYRSGIDDADTGDDEDDAEIVIVNSASKAAGVSGSGTPPDRQSPRVFRDSPPNDDDDADVEIVRPGTRPGTLQSADGRAERTPARSESDRARAAASKPTAPAKWRLFRGSR